MANDYYGNMSGAASCSSSRWLTEEVFKLIDMVQHDEAIYNPRHKYYFCRPYVENFWREVDQKLEKNPGASLAKWTNLRISFRREYTNYLEEKVPPCWTYFDRMFFLHPYLRKKHSPPKSLDSQVQDALVRISSLSDRLQRANTTAAITGDVHSSHLHTHQTYQQPNDNYLEYFDDAEHNNSDDLEDVIDDEHVERFRHKSEHHHTLALRSDIKSECDDVKSDVDDYDAEIVTRHEEEDNELEEMEMRNFMMDSYASHSSSSSTPMSLEDRRTHWRMQQLMRLQTRAYQDEPRIKRPRSQENISSTHAISGSLDVNAASSTASAVLNAHNSVSLTPGIGGQARAHNAAASTAAVHANVSFVRPTLAKPMELVSTTTSNNGTIGLSVGGGASTTSNVNNDVDAISTSSATNQVATTSATALSQQQQRDLRSSYHMHNYGRHIGSSGGGVNAGGGVHHRLEIAAISAGSSTGAGMTTTSAGSSSETLVNKISAAASAQTAAATPSAAAHVELCDCKTDSDAMFLMSLLPDIQKLNGRDRGKIKIAFQNILQDYLYPD